MRSYNEIAEKLFVQLEERSKIILDPQKLAETAVKEISSSLYLLREQVQNIGFNSECDEINFFKSIKPRLVSHLSYYQFLYEIESLRPALSEKKVKNLLKVRKNVLLKDINRYTGFMNYFRSKCSEMDHHYFIRGNFECKPCALKMHNLLDPGFSTTHDFLVSKIMTYDLFCCKSDEITSTISISAIDNTGLNFTDSKVAITELAYALYFSGSVNNGKADIREICLYLGKIFNIELNDFYRTYLDIKSRKGSKTRFLEKLVTIMNTAIHEDEGI